MSSWFDFYFTFLSSSNDAWTGPVLKLSTVLNFVAAAILAAALFPPFLDTKRSKKTYGVSDSFFLYYVMGGACMWVNAVVNILVQANEVVKGDNKGDAITMIVLFGIFMCVNSLSLYLNTYILKVKRTNMKEAAARGISEQDYWTKYLSTEAVSQTDAAA